MKISIFLIFSFLASVGQWQVFTSEEGAFSVLAPKEMEKSSKSIPTEIGKIVYNTYSCTFENDTTAQAFAYVISYCDLPEGSIPADSTAFKSTYLEESLESIRENLDAEVLYQDAIAPKGHMGLIARLAYANGEGQMKTKIILAGNRFYSLQVFMTAQNSLNRDADKFLDSFVLL